MENKFWFYYDEDKDKDKDKDKDNASEATRASLPTAVVGITETLYNKCINTKGFWDKKEYDSYQLYSKSPNENQWTKLSIEKISEIISQAETSVKKKIPVFLCEGFYFLRDNSTATVNDLPDSGKCIFLYENSQLYPTKNPEEYYPKEKNNQDDYAWNVLNAPIEYKVIQILLMLQQKKVNNINFYFFLIFWFTLCEKELRDGTFEKAFKKIVSSFFTTFERSTIREIYTSIFMDSAPCKEKFGYLHAFIGDLLTCCEKKEELPLSMLIALETGVLFEENEDNEDNLFKEKFSSIKKSFMKLYDSEYHTWKEREETLQEKDLELILSKRQEEEAKALLDYLRKEAKDETFDDCSKRWASVIKTSKKWEKTKLLIRSMAAHINEMEITFNNLEYTKCGRYLYQFLDIVYIDLEKNDGEVSKANWGIVSFSAPNGHEIKVDQLDNIFDIYEQVNRKDDEDSRKVRFFIRKCAGLKAESYEFGNCSLMQDLLENIGVLFYDDSKKIYYKDGNEGKTLRAASKDYLKNRIRYLETLDEQYRFDAAYDLASLRQHELKATRNSNVVVDNKKGKLYKKLCDEIMNIFNDEKKYSISQRQSFKDNLENYGIPKSLLVKFNVFQNKTVDFGAKYNISLENALGNDGALPVMGKFPVDEKTCTPLSYLVSLLSEDVWKQSGGLVGHDIITEKLDDLILDCPFGSPDQKQFSEKIKKIQKSVVFNERLKYLALIATENKEEFNLAKIKIYNHKNSYDPRLTVLYLYELKTTKAPEEFKSIVSANKTEFTSKNLIGLFNTVVTKISDVYSKNRKEALGILKDPDKYGKISVEHLKAVCRSYFLSRGTTEVLLAKKMVEVLSFEDLKKEYEEVEGVIQLTKESERWFRNLDVNYRNIRNIMDLRYADFLFEDSWNKIRDDNGTMRKDSPAYKDLYHSMMLRARIQLIYQQDLMSVKSLPKVASVLMSQTHLANLMGMLAESKNSVITQEQVAQFNEQYKKVSSWQAALEAVEKESLEFWKAVITVVFSAVSAVLAVLSLGLSVIVSAVLSAVAEAIHLCLDQALLLNFQRDTLKPSIKAALLVLIDILKTTIIGCHFKVQYDERSKTSSTPKDQLKVEHLAKVSCAHASAFLLKSVFEDKEQVDLVNDENTIQKLAEIQQRIFKKVLAETKNNLKYQPDKEVIRNSICEGFKKGQGFSEEGQNKLKEFYKAQKPLQEVA